MPHSAPACDEAQMVWLLPVDWWPLLSDRGRMLRGFSILVLSLLLLARSVMAEQILRDAETEALFNSISAPLEEAAGMDPRNVQELLINEPEIKAFVAGDRNSVAYGSSVSGRVDQGGRRRTKQKLHILTTISEKKQSMKE